MIKQCSVPKGRRLGVLALVLLCLSAAAGWAQSDPEITQTLTFRRLMLLNESTIGAGSLTNGFMEMSADGSTIVFSTSNKKVYTIGAGGGGPTLIFDYASINPPASQPVFVDISANGTRIIWTDKADEIYTALSNGSGIVRLATEFDDPFNPEPRGPTIPVPPKLTGDGSRVIFANTLGGGDAWADIAGVWSVNVDGSGLNQIFSYRTMTGAVFGTNGSEYNPGVAFTRGFDVSDSGARIVFATRAGFGPEAVVAYDGSFNQIWDAFPGSDQLVLSPDGSTVALVPNLGERRGTVVKLPFSGGDAVTVSEGALFADFELSGDGSRLGFNSGGATLGRLPLSVIDLVSGKRNDLMTLCPGNGYLLARQASFSWGLDRFAFVTGTTPQELWVGEIGRGGDGGPVLADPDFNPAVITKDGSGASTFSVVAVAPEDETVRQVCFDSFDASGAFVSRAFEGGGRNTLEDDGTAGDDTAGDGIYTRENVSSRLPATPPGEYTIRFYARTEDFIRAIDAFPLRLTDRSAPVITAIEPAEAMAGAEVVIEGENFNPDPDKNSVLFDSLEAEVVSASEDRLVVIVPAGTDLGQIEVTVSSEGLDSDPEAFTVLIDRSFTVNIDSDESDYDLDDGVCDVNRDEPGNQCSLRAAIQNANLTEEVDEITFDVPGGRQARIYSGDVDVYIAQTPVIIDGTTQAGGMMDLYGCIQLLGGDSTVRGMVINRCGGTAVYIAREGNNVVEQNFFGVDVSGTQPSYPWGPDDFFSNGSNILISMGSQNNVIRYNVISNGVGDGILILGSANSRGERPENTRIEYNRIGTDSSGTVAIPNQGNGIEQHGAVDLYIENNVISGNLQRGILISNASTRINDVAAVINDNVIGATADGDQALGNGSHGIEMSVGWGGPITGEQRVDVEVNIISGNEGYGIVIHGPAGNRPDAPNGLVKQNTIGMNFDRSKAIGNEAGGIFLDGWGTTHILTNTISGNGGHGISSRTALEGRLFSQQRIYNYVIENNWIGLNPSWIGFGNDGDGIRVAGGRLDILSNAIGANSGYAIHFATVRDSKIRQNWIGTGPVWERLHNELGGVAIVNPFAENCFTTPQPYDCPSKLRGLSTQNTVSANRIGYNGPVGVFLEYVRDNEVVGNSISFHEVGVELKNGVNSVTSNYLWYNGTGILAYFEPVTLPDGRVVESLSEKNRISGNSIRSNGPSTGIRLEAAAADIRGNSVADETGDGILLQDGAKATITQNNLVGSAALAVNNAAGSAVVAASGNWWGDASGPSGAGSGSGDAVGSNVDFSGWVENPVGVVVSSASDTVLVHEGETGVVRFALRDWSDPTGFVNVTVDDPSGLVSGTIPSTVSLNDSTGGTLELTVSIPAAKTAADHTIRVTASAASGSPSPLNLSVDSVIVVTYVGELAELAIAPDTLTLAPGETAVFGATAIDTLGRPLRSLLVWTATGGSVTADGVYTAGDEPGTYEVTATDPASGISATAVVTVATATATVDGSDLPGVFSLEANYPNPFISYGGTTIEFETPSNGAVRLAVFDMLGRRVGVLIDDQLPAGRRHVRFAARDLPAGIYFYRLDAGGFSETRKMIVLH